MFAEVNDEQPIYRGKQNMNHVLDPDDRYATLPDHFDDLRKLMTLAVSKAAGDFIQQEENWFGRERARSRRFRSRSVNVPAAKLDLFSNPVRSRASMDRS